MTLYGPSGAGKTGFIESYVRKRSAGGKSPDTRVVNSLYVETPHQASVGDFLTEVLDVLGDGLYKRGTVAERLRRVLGFLKKTETQILFVDEAQHIEAGGPRQTDLFLNLLKTLSNRSRLPIILAGSEDLYELIRTNKMLYNRFPPVALPAWRLDDDFTTLVTKVLQTLPIQHRGPLPRAVLHQLFQMSDGALGTLVQLMECAAIAAIRAGHERLDLDALQAVAHRFPAWRDK